MPNVERTRTIPVPPKRVWALVSDPHNLPRWFPETVRVEDVQGQVGAARSRFTQVLSTKDGKPVRADFRCVAATSGERFVWKQELEGTPFERFMKEAELEVRIRPESGEGTQLTIAARRRLRGLSRLGSPMMRRATGRTLDSALGGIEDALLPRSAGEPER